MALDINLTEANAGAGKQGPDAIVPSSEAAQGKALSYQF